MGGANVSAEWEGPGTKGHILFESLYGKYSEGASPQRQRGNEPLFGLGQGSNGFPVPFGAASMFWNQTLVTAAPRWECHHFVQFKVVKTGCYIGIFSQKFFQCKK